MRATTWPCFSSVATGAGELEAIGVATTRVRLATDTLDWLAMRLLRLDADFVVEKPVVLRRFVAGLGRRLRRAGATTR